MVAAWMQAGPLCMGRGLLYTLMLLCTFESSTGVGDGGRREYIELKGGPPGVAWVVQLSDFHVSSYHPNRALALRNVVGPLLALINPALVLITGDLTDGKTLDRATMRQDEAEWIQYNEAILSVVQQSGLPQYAFFDMHGNHDKFGVPETGGSLDYFSKYSINALQNRTGNIQSVTLLDGKWRHLFVGLDSSMNVGLRGPSNLFGHVTERDLETMDRELSQWNGTELDKITKLVYGHFPTSFTTSTEKGHRLETIFAKHDISAYLCGHLHYQFGRHLFKHHKFSSLGKVGEFWEWEVGDWKENKVVRIIGIDEGQTSFLDLDLTALNITSADELQHINPIVLVTFPLDSQKMQRAMPFPAPIAENSVRALVFSQRPVISAVARFFDTHASLVIPAEELQMQQTSKMNDKVLFFIAYWNATKYVDPSPTRFMLQIVVSDSLGNQGASDFRSFSVKGGICKIKWTWKEYFVMGIVWDALYMPLLWTAFGILLTILVLPELYRFYLLRESTAGFSAKIPHSRSLDTLTLRNVIDELLIRSYGDHTLWWGQLLLVFYLMFLPWFWGFVLAEGYPTGYLSAWGWSVKMVSGLQSGLGVPDVVVIVLPHLYYVILPLYVLIFCLSAEYSFFELHTNRDSTEVKFVRHKAMSCQENSCKICRRWLRKALFVGCLGVIYLHARQTAAMVGAYGMKALLLSPGFTWPLPVLLTTAFLQTSTVRRHSTCE